MFKSVVLESIRRLSVCPSSAEQRLFMRECLASPVVLVSCYESLDGRGKEFRAATASSFCSVSIGPPYPVVSVAFSSSGRLARIIRDTRKFQVHVLHRQQGDIARRLADPRTEQAEAELLFQESSMWRDSVVLKGGIGTLHCQLENSVQVHQQEVFFGRVMCSEWRHESSNIDPLLYFKQGFYSPIPVGNDSS